MTDRELLEALYNNMTSLHNNVESLHNDMEIIKQKVTNLEMTLENETNHNIQLLAENHINLVDKLNQAIKVQDKSLLYEVQVSGLKMKLERLEKEIEDIKSRIA